jgi:hypothetical protein
MGWGSEGCELRERWRNEGGDFCFLLFFSVAIVRRRRDGAGEWSVQAARGGGSLTNELANCRELRTIQVKKANTMLIYIQ